MSLLNIILFKNNKSFFTFIFYLFTVRYMHSIETINNFLLLDYSLATMQNILGSGFFKYIHYLIKARKIFFYIRFHSFTAVVLNRCAVDIKGMPRTRLRKIVQYYTKKFLFCRITIHVHQI